jgi:hypothetical protein
VSRTEALDGLVTHTIEKLGGERELTLITDLHLSVTKTANLSLHELIPFEKTVSQAFCNVERFVVELRKGCWFVNQDRSRSFLALCVDDGLEDVRGFTMMVCKFNA